VLGSTDHGDYERVCSPAATETTATEPVVSPSASGSRISIRSMEGKVVLSDETNDIWSMRADGALAD
jgi:hypothetical protein